MKDGGGLLILSMANNTYSGGTFVANGTLRVGSNYALGQIGARLPCSLAPLKS